MDEEEGECGSLPPADFVAIKEELHDDESSEAEFSVSPRIRNNSFVDDVFILNYEAEVVVVAKEVEIAEVGVIR